MKKIMLLFLIVLVLSISLKVTYLMLNENHYTQYIDYDDENIPDLVNL